MTARQRENHQFTVGTEAGARLDLWISGRLGLSRSQLKKLIDQGLVLVNGAEVKAGYLVRPGDQISVFLPEIEQPVLKAEPLPLKIIYEDEALAVVEKPKGLTVHPGAGRRSGTLVNALLFHLDRLGGGEESFRPGIVHRLDHDTSGLMVVAKTEESYALLAGEFQRQLVQRRYLALVQGAPSEPQGVIDRPIGRHPKDRKKMTVVQGGRAAQTIYELQERFPKYSLLRCRLVTGRTHQIRVHLASIHHPIVGDPIYGFKKGNLGAQTQMLHAEFLAFRHPQGRVLEFQSDPGPEFWEIVQKARLCN